MCGDKLYRIVNWSELYENAESIKYKRLRWVPIPNKFEGKGMALIRREEDAIELYTAWVLMVALASKAYPQERRGYLEDNDGPLNAEDMALITGFPQGIFERALDFFTSGRMHWLEVAHEESEEVTPIHPEVSGDLRRSPELPPMNRIELNRIEKNKKDQKQGADAPRETKKPAAKKDRSFMFPSDFPECFQADEFGAAWNNFRAHRQKLKKPMTRRAEELLINRLQDLSMERVDLAIRIMDQSIIKGWQDVFELKIVTSTNGHATQTGQQQKKPKQQKPPTWQWDTSVSYGKCTSCDGDCYQRFVAGGDQDTEVRCQKCLTEWEPKGGYHGLDLSSIGRQMPKGEPVEDSRGE